MKHLLFIAVGSSFGAISRYTLSKWISGSLNSVFPWGTLVVNITGSFFIGFLFELFDKTIIHSDYKSFLTIGFLGAYTTFSTYTLESINLIRDGNFYPGLYNIILSNILGIIFVIAGIFSGKLLLNAIK